MGAFGMEMKFWVLCLASVIVSAEAKPKEDGKWPNDDDDKLDKEGFMKSLKEGQDGNPLPEALAVSEGSGSGEGSGEGPGEGFGKGFRSMPLDGTDPDSEEYDDGYVGYQESGELENGMDMVDVPDNKTQNSYRSFGLQGLGEQDNEDHDENPEKIYRSLPPGIGEGEGTKKKSKMEELLQKLNPNNGGSDNGGSDNGGSDNFGSDFGGSDNGGSDNSGLSSRLKRILNDKSGNEEGGKQVTSVVSEAEQQPAAKSPSPTGMPRKDVVKMLKHLQTAPNHRKKAEEDLLRVGDLFAKNGFLSENHP